MFVYIIAAIVIFSFLIAIHEAGHFAAAKLLGVQVNEFSIGMGPAIWKKQKGETLYALRILPIGGYCAMEGEDDESDNPRAFTNKSWWRRLVILFAGSFMNFVAGFLAILIIFSSATAFYIPEVALTADDYSGPFAVGDEIVEIDGEKIYIYSDIFTLLNRSGGSADILVERGGEQVLLENATLSKSELTFGVVKATVGQKIKMGWLNSIDFVRLVKISLVDLVRGAVGLDELSGPIGIVEVMGEVGAEAESAGEAVENIAYLAAFIAINLAVMNMLPVPALDGGRIFFLLITTVVEKIRKKRLDPKYEGYVHFAGLIFFFGLMIFVACNDVIKIFSK